MEVGGELARSSSRMRAARSSSSRRSRRPSAGRRRWPARRRRPRWRPPTRRRRPAHRCGWRARRRRPRAGRRRRRPGRPVPATPPTVGPAPPPSDQTMEIPTATAAAGTMMPSPGHSPMARQTTSTAPVAQPIASSRRHRSHDGSGRGGGRLGAVGRQDGGEAVEHDAEPAGERQQPDRGPHDGRLDTPPVGPPAGHAGDDAVGPSGHAQGVGHAWARPPVSRAIGARRPSGPTRDVRRPARGSTREIPDGAARRTSVPSTTWTSPRRRPTPPRPGPAATAPEPAARARLRRRRRLLADRLGVDALWVRIGVRAPGARRRRRPPRLRGDVAGVRRRRRARPALGPRRRRRRARARPAAPAHRRASTSSTGRSPCWPCSPASPSRCGNHAGPPRGTPVAVAAPTAPPTRDVAGPGDPAPATDAARLPACRTAAASAVDPRPPDARRRRPRRRRRRADRPGQRRAAAPRAVARRGRDHLRRRPRRRRVRRTGPVAGPAGGAVRRRRLRRRRGGAHRRRAVGADRRRRRASVRARRATPRSTSSSGRSTSRSTGAPRRRSRVDARTGVGDVALWAAADVTVEVRAAVDHGGVDVDGVERPEGTFTIGPEGAPDVIVAASVGRGGIDVEQWTVRRCDDRADDRAASAGRDVADGVTLTAGGRFVFAGGEAVLDVDDTVLAG